MTFQAAARPGEALTHRETEVLRHMADGLSNAEIGRLLFISEDTVKTHARRLFKKLGARDRAHAVGIGYRRRILDPGAATAALTPPPITPGPAITPCPPVRPPPAPTAIYLRLRRVQRLLGRWTFVLERLPARHPLRRFCAELAGILADGERRESA